MSRLKPLIRGAGSEKPLVLLEQLVPLASKQTNSNRPDTDFSTKRDLSVVSHVLLKDMRGIVLRDVSARASCAA
jgi:hypothetical protein